MGRFKVGQKIVCIDDSPTSTDGKKLLKKGDIFTVIGIKNNPCCGVEVLDIGINHCYPQSRCGRCMKIINNHNCFRLSRFAPIEEYTDSVSIAQSLVEELSKTDKAKNPVKEFEKI